MFQKLFPSLNRTFENFKKHPQLLWTIFVALAITVSFIVVAQLFITIAEDAQERVVNVRIGSIQDSLAEFVVLDDSSKEKVSRAISNLMVQNPTILDFTFYKKEGDQFVVYASSDASKEGQKLEQISKVAQLALNDVQNSYTTEYAADSERLFQTVRGLQVDGILIGMVETTQTISQADQIIEQNIQKGIIVFLIMLVLVMFLFFRHSRIIDYVTLYEELKKVDTLKDDFISMASHELKTPLAAIRGYSEFITDGENIPEEYKEYSRRIDVSSKQLALLVEDMLEVSQLEQGRIIFEEQKILVPDFIKKLSDDFKVLAQEKNLEFTIVQEGLKLSYITADEVRLRQVLLNIVGNAIKYTKEGRVEILLSNIKESLEIRVRDTGIGMTEEERNRLFDKFYRVKNNETQNIKGTGLGLWITKQLVEKMNGTISVESIKGVGTHVILRFEAFV